MHRKPKKNDPEIKLKWIPGGDSHNTTVDAEGAMCFFLWNVERKKGVGSEKKGRREVGREEERFH